MKSSSIAALVGLTVLAAITFDHGAAAAEDAAQDSAFAKRLFAGDVDAAKKSYACFVRRYDAAHLAQHPRQKVSAMKLLVTAETEPEDKSLNYSFRLGVNFRNRPGDFDSSGDCGHPASVRAGDKLYLKCAVDCDAGGISVELSNADKSTLVRLDSIGIWRNNKLDQDGLTLSGGADDRVLRLDRADIEQCRPLVTDRKELAAMRHK